MYPIAYQAAYEPERSRLTTFFRYIWAIPLFLVAIVYGIAAYVAVIVAWFAIVFTGRYPAGLYEFNAKALRYFARLNSYVYLLTDAYPAFNGDDDPNYPVRVVIGERLPEYSRLKTLFRIILFIPVYLMLIVYGVILYFVPLLSWLVIVFTARQPEGLQDLTRMAVSYGTRAGAYFMLLTEEFPPISDTNELPAGAVSSQLSS